VLILSELVSQGAEFNVIHQEIPFGKSAKSYRAINQILYWCENRGIEVTVLPYEGCELEYVNNGFPMGFLLYLMLDRIATNTDRTVINGNLGDIFWLRDQDFYSCFQKPKSILKCPYGLYVEQDFPALVQQASSNDPNPVLDTVEFYNTISQYDVVSPYYWQTSFDCISGGILHKCTGDDMIGIYDITVPRQILQENQHEELSSFVVRDKYYADINFNPRIDVEAELQKFKMDISTKNKLIAGHPYDVLDYVAQRNFLYDQKDF